MDLNWNLLEKLSKQYGESFYLLDSKRFAQNYDNFIESFRRIYPKTNIGYSYKTNYIPKLCSIINKKGGYAEVVSEMEFDLAIKIGVPAKKIIINGPYKDKKSLEKYLLQGSLVNLDSFQEVIFVKEIAVAHPKSKLNIGLRCNFDINNELVSRFGFDITNKEFHSMFKKLQKIDNINIKGLHCHFPNRDLESFKIRTDKLINVAKKLFIVPPAYLSIGGGYFGNMEPSLKKQFQSKIPTYKKYAEIIATKFNTEYKDIKENMKPTLFLEPGSAIVANTIKFVCKVIDIKKIHDTHIAMTTGSKFNIGLLSSKINLPLNIYRNPKYKQPETYNSIDISGYTCIESDYLYEGYSGALGINDYLVFDNAGSYSIVFKPPFIMPNVAIIDYDLQQDTYDVVKRKENMEDIFRTYTFNN